MQAKMYKALQLGYGYVLAVLNTREVFLLRQRNGYIVIVFDGTATQVRCVESFHDAVVETSKALGIGLAQVQDNLNPCEIGFHGDLIAVLLTTATRKDSYFYHSVRMYKGNESLPTIFGCSREQVLFAANAWLESEGYAIV